MRTLGLAGICVVAMLLPAAPVSAAQTIGSDLAPDPINSACASAMPCTVANTTLPGAQLASPIDGVVVRWRVRVATSQAASAALRVLRPGAGGSFTGISRSAERAIAPTGATTFTQATRQPIDAGDRIGLDLGGDTGNATVATGPTLGTTQVRWEPPLGGGATAAPDSTVTNSLEILFNADIEPDADCDGFGDESQDTSISGGCLPDPPQADTTAPDTEITKGPTKKVKTRKRKRKVTFEFGSSEAGSSFRCATDGGAEEACSSPLKEKLKRGKHIFSVYAVDPAGNADPTPAERKFKIKRKR